MWQDIIKAKGDVQLNFLLKHGMTKDFQSSDEIIARMRNTGKKTGGRFTPTGLISRLKKLRSRGLIESKDQYILGEDRRRQILVWRLTNSEVVKAGKKSVNRVLFRNAMYDVTSQYLIENHSGDEINIKMVEELKDTLKLLGIQKLKDDGYEGRMLGNFQSWWINQFERQLPAVLNKMIRLRLADKGAGIGENKGTTAYLLKAKNVRLKKKILHLLEGEDWLSTQEIMGKLIDIKFRDTPSNSNALSMIINQIKEVDSRRVTNRGIVIDPSVVNYLTVRHIKQFKLKGEDIIKSGNKGKKPNKVKGEILRTVVSEYLEETGYRDYYIIGDAFEKIYPRYFALHAPEAAAISKYKLLEGKVLQSLPAYFPSPYVSKPISKNNIIYRIVVKENIDLTNFGERMILKIQTLAMLESKMSKAYDPKPPNKVTPNMEEDIDYVTGENEYENNPTLSQKIKQILSLKPIPYSPKKPKKEDVDKEDNCGCNSCNDVSKGKKKSSKCTGRTKKTSSKVKGKKWTQCVPTGEKGKYRRANWGQAGVKVTGDSGNTKRKKSFRARHKCKTCKLDNGPKRYYSNQCLACRDW
tara:strand:+ start:4635 stop:6377 length:1743 start_codon:yes stop_codon:yes gene_type:complete